LRLPNIHAFCRATWQSSHEEVQSLVAFGPALVVTTWQEWSCLLQAQASRGSECFHALLGTAQHLGASPASLLEMEAHHHPSHLQLSAQTRVWGHRRPASPGELQGV
jgi:hypothetical protein